MMHDFNESLELSHQYEAAGWWIEVYRAAFPNLSAAVSVRHDGWAQRGGIDRVLTLDCGRQIKVDEKVRKEDWPDFALEQWSDVARKIPGWIQKPLACDFLAYAFVPSQTCYLLPMLTLQRAWRIHGRDWIKIYPAIRAENQDNITHRRWTTVCVPVPRDVLLESLADAMCVVWGDV